jgi:N-acyl homoserine lactone hydrolase
MEGGEGQVELPIPYLIAHPRGTVVFDTGMHPDCQRDPARRVGSRIAGLFSFRYQPGEEISARLEAMITTRRELISSSTPISISTMWAAMR